MGVIYLVRHGQALPGAYGVADDDPQRGGLTALGRRQADLAGTALGHRLASVDHIVSGSLLRQRQTCQVIVSSIQERLPAPPPPEVDSRWDEYDIDAILGRTGAAANSSGRELQHRVDDALRSWVGGATPPGAESYAAFRARAAAALATAVALAGPGRSVLAVSSAGLITQILAQIWKVADTEWIRMSRTMINASITKLIVGRSEPAIVSMNEHAHLDLSENAGPQGLMTFR